MKIALNAIAQTPGHASGALSQYLQMGRFLPRCDPESDYYFIAGGDDAAYFRERLPGMRVTAAGWGNRRRLLRILSEHLLLAPILRRDGVDVLFQGGAGVAPIFLPRRCKLVLAVWAMHHLATGQISGAQRLYRSLLFDRSLKRADALVVNSQYTKDLLTQHAPDLATPISVIHHGIDASLFHAAPLSEADQQRVAELGARRPYALFVGQIYPYKLLHVLAEAYCEAVSRQGLPHSLVVVGQFSTAHGSSDAYREGILGILARHGLSDRLVMASDINVRDLRLLYGAADLYVQSSEAETFGRTVIEAMACGCPVLAARAGATPEILGDAGAYYEARDAAECGAELERLLLDGPERRRLAHAGLERVTQFSFEREMAAMVEVFHQAGAGANA